MTHFTADKKMLPCLSVFLVTDIFKYVSLNLNVMEIGMGNDEMDTNA